MQSYSAYDEYLDSLNSAKYASSSAPRWILLAYRCVDSRYCFFDEAKTKLTLLENYSVRGELGDFLLLEREPGVKKITSRPFGEGRGTLGQKLRLPDTKGLQYSRLNVELSLLGRIAQTFYQIPELKITFELENRRRFVHRAVLPIIAGGVLLNRYIPDLKREALFLQGESGNLSKVRSIILGTEGLWAYKPEFTYSTTLYGVHTSSNE